MSYDETSLDCSFFEILETSSPRIYFSGGSGLAYFFKLHYAAWWTDNKLTKEHITHCRCPYFSKCIHPWGESTNHSFITLTWDDLGVSDSGSTACSLAVALPLRISGTVTSDLTLCNVCNRFWFLSSSCFLFSILASRLVSSDATLFSTSLVFSSLSWTPNTDTEVRVTSYKLL